MGYPKEYINWFFKFILKTSDLKSYLENFKGKTEDWDIIVDNFLSNKLDNIKSLLDTLNSKIIPERFNQIEKPSIIQGLKIEIEKFYLKNKFKE